MAARPVLPDVVGYPVEEARAALAGAGCTDVDVEETRPPRRALGGPARVVRQRPRADGGAALVVCGEHTEDVRV